MGVAEGEVTDLKRVVGVLETRMGMAETALRELRAVTRKGDPMNMNHEWLDGKFERIQDAMHSQTKYLLGAFAAGFVLLAGFMYQVSSNVSELTPTVRQLSSTVAELGQAVDKLTDRLDQSHPESR